MDLQALRRCLAHGRHPSFCWWAERIEDCQFRPPLSFWGKCSRAQFKYWQAVSWAEGAETRQRPVPPHLATSIFNTLAAFSVWFQVPSSACWYLFSSNSSLVTRTVQQLILAHGVPTLGSLGPEHKAGQGSRHWATRPMALTGSRASAPVPSSTCRITPGATQLPTTKSPAPLAATPPHSAPHPSSGVQGRVKPTGHMGRPGHRCNTT